MATATVKTGKFTFFYTAASPFSQFYFVNFKVDGVDYTCAEQYMMHQKAGELILLFKNIYFSVFCFDLFCFFILKHDYGL